MAVQSKEITISADFQKIGTIYLESLLKFFSNEG